MGPAEARGRNYLPGRIVGNGTLSEAEGFPPPHCKYSLSTLRGLLIIMLWSVGRSARGRLLFVRRHGLHPLIGFLLSLFLRPSVTLLQLTDETLTMSRDVLEI